MKLIKYFLLTIMLLGSIVANAQYYYDWSRTGETIYVVYMSTTVFTPNSSIVTVDQWVSGDWSSTTKSDIINYWYSQPYGNRLTFESEATVKYNCHAWAWAGGTTYWMNSPEEQKYFSSANYNTPSYASTTNTALATKVWYGSADHSANTTNTSAFSSKWGRGPRFRHLVADCPYSTTLGLTYYNGLSSITGSDPVCTGGSTFTVSNISVVPYTWAWSSNLTAGAPSGHNRTFSAANSSTSGTGWVAINVDGVEYVKKPVWVGKPILTNIACEGGYGGLYHWVAYSENDVSQVEWIASGFDNNGNAVWGTVISRSYHGTYSVANIQFNSSGTYTISAYAVNSCGAGNVIDVYNFTVY